LGIFLRVHTRTHTTLTSYTRVRVHTHGREKIGETCISAERAHACIHSNLGMDALCLARGVALPTLLLPYECAHVEDNLHLQGLFSCFTVKDLYLLLSAPWPFGLTWYKRKEKKKQKGLGVELEGGLGRAQRCPTRRRSRGSTAHGGLASQTGAQLRGRGPEFRMSSSVWAEREPTPSPPTNPGQSRF
jgi:hypothetical protein